MIVPRRGLGQQQPYVTPDQAMSMVKAFPWIIVGLIGAFLWVNHR